MRHLLAAGIAAFAVSAVSPVVSAKDLTGRVGVGYTTTLPGGGGGSLSAVSARYWVNEQVGLEANFGLLQLSPKGGKSSNNYGFGLGGMYSFIDEPNLHVYGDAGLSFGSVGVTVPAGAGGGTTTDQKTAIGVTAGMGVEFFIVGLPNLGFATQVGLSYVSVTDQGSSIALGGADYASLGIRYYFGGPKGPPK